MFSVSNVCASGPHEREIHLHNNRLAVKLLMVLHFFAVQCIIVIFLPFHIQLCSDQREGKSVSVVSDEAASYRLALSHT